MPDTATWPDLLSIYLKADFGSDENAYIQITDAELLETIKRVEKFDEDSGGDANLAVLEPHNMQVGSKVRLRIGAPRPHLGTFVENFDQFLMSPNAKLAEPKAYFIKEGRLHNGQSVVSDLVVRYRLVVRFVQVLAKAALYFDLQKPELVFFKEGKIALPIRYNAQQLRYVRPESIAELESMLSSETHVEQKEAMLAEAVARLAVSQRAEGRFVYLMQNVGEIVKQVRDGYKLFMSSFSYEKIRSQIENAQSEYISRIHKTFVDVQGQLLGIPVATIIVASQLKRVTECDVSAWANFAIVCGAWVFVVFLWFACINQWATLSSINVDVGRQKSRLLRDYAIIEDQFSSLFLALERRVCYHRAALMIVMIISFAGAVFAAFAYRSLTSVSVLNDCLLPLLR